MRRVLLLTGLFFWTLAGSVKADGISFFKGTFQEALQKAKAENKKVFVDFYTTWCGPCQIMEKNIFTREDVGAYFNEHFVNYQINAEDKAFAGEVARYEIKAYPNMLILDAGGNVLGRQLGATDRDGFLRFAKMALKEVLPFDQLYAKYQKDKKNLDLIQEILLGAPDYIARLTSEQEHGKWSFRAGRLYADYMKQKKLEDCINRNDLMIFSLYHTEAVENDKIFEFVLSHFDEYVRVCDKDEVSKYLFSLNYFFIQGLARKGDERYLKELARTRGDLKEVYAAMMNFEGMDAYTGLKLMFEADYYLYSKKDVDKYCSLMNEYFTRLGKGVTGMDYVAALESLYEALKEKLTPLVATQGVNWLQEALKENMQPDNQMRCLIMLGDCYKVLGNKPDAKKSYDQAYMVSLQFGNPRLSATVQEYVKKLDE